jgi:hypothetical protein
VSISADLVKVLTATLGTGAVTLGSAVTGFRTFASAGIPNGATVTYGIFDNNQHEVGRGVYNSGAGTLTRTLIASSTGALLELSGGAQVYITATASDLTAGNIPTITVTGGTADAMVASSPVNLPVGPLATGDLFYLVTTGPNTVNNPTLNVNGAGVKTMTSADGSVVPLKAWPAAATLLLKYDGAGFRVIDRLDGVASDAVIPCDVVTPNSLTFILTSQKGHHARDDLQAVTFRPATGNGAGAVARHPDFFGGADVPIVLENGVAAPLNAIRNGYPVTLRAKTFGGNGWVLESPSAQQQMAVIPMTTASTGSLIVANFADAAAKYPADLGPDLIGFGFFAQADKPAGGGQWQIPGVLGTVNIYDFDGVTALDVGAWKKGSWVVVTKIKTGETFAGNFRLVSVSMPFASVAQAIAGTDTRQPINAAGLAAVIADVEARIGRFNYLVANERTSSLRTVKVSRPSTRRIVLEVGMFPADFRGIYAGSHMVGDATTFELMNLSGWYHANQTSTELWVVISIKTRIANREVEWMNYTIDALAGSSGDNGQIFSVNEIVTFVGKNTDSVAAVQATNGQGPGHGYINAQNGQFYTTNAIKNGQPIPDGTNILAAGPYQLKVGEIMFCATFQQQGLWNILCPDGVTVAYSYGVFKEWGNGRQMRQLLTLTMQNNIQMLFGYGTMLKYRVPTRFEGRDKAGNAYVPRITGLKDGHQEIFTDMKSLVGLYEPPAGAPDTSFKGHGLEIKLVDSYTPYRVGGAEPVGYPPTPIVTDEDSGPAFRSLTWTGGTDFEDVSNQVYQFMSDISGIRTNVV